MAVKIVQGEDKKLIVKLETEDGDAFDLTDMDEIAATFKKSDGTQLELKMTESQVEIVDSKPQNGKIAILLTDTHTSSFKETSSGKEAGFEIVLDDGTERKIVQFPGALEIAKRIT